MMKNSLSLLIFLFFLLSCNNLSKKETAVNEKTFIELGGKKQYVEMTGVSDQKPILLFIHGGPGWPQTPFLRYFNSDLTKSFILVSWDQAGCGQSFMKDPAPGDLSLAQFINDAHELTGILKKKFNQEKIFVAGYSWGSIIGLKLVREFPEDYNAYFGVGQSISITKGIKATREWLRKSATEKNDTASLRILKALDEGDTSFCKSPLDCFVKQYDLVAKYNGAVFSKNVEPELEKAMTIYDDYKNYNWDAGFNYAAYRLENDLFNTDLGNITSLKIPVYFFLGRHDWNVPSVVAENYFDKLDCPKKEIIWFENSGHELSCEEAALFNQKMAEKAVQ